MSATNGTTNGTHHEADEAIDVLYSWFPASQPAPQPCPEALFSLTLKGKLDGIETLLTVRGMTSEEFKKNLAAVRGLLDAPQAQTPAPTTAPTPQCPQHGAMQPSSKGKGWYCPHRMEDDTWCPSKGK
jgi:hypothetical protein